MYSLDTFSSCPYCKLMNSDETLKEQIANYEEYKKDTAFRIEYNPGEMQSLKEDTKALVVFIIIIAFLLLILTPWFLVMRSLYLSYPEDAMTSPIFIFLSIFGVVGIFGIIYITRLLLKIKYLMKKGIILKNVKFTPQIDNATLGAERPPLIKVKIKYVTENGTEYIFKGTLPSARVKNGDVCDVLVDPNNYKKYMIRYNIF